MTLQLVKVTILTITEGIPIGRMRDHIHQCARRSLDKETEGSRGGNGVGQVALWDRKARTGLRGGLEAKTRKRWVS